MLHVALADVTETYTFHVPGTPRSKQRPRLTRRGKAYTPAGTHEAEDGIRCLYQGPFFDGPVAVFVAYDKHGQTITLTEWDGIESKLRGDVDNMLKLTLDGLQPVAFANDKQVHRVTGVKA